MKRSMTTTLALAMVSFFCLSLRSEAALKAEKVEYKQGSTVLTGYLAYEDSYPTPRPGVLVVHEWWGLNDYAKKRAEALAREGVYRPGRGYVRRRKALPIPRRPVNGHRPCGRTNRWVRRVSWPAMNYCATNP